MRKKNKQCKPLSDIHKPPILHMLIRVQFHHHFQFLIFIFPFSISIISTEYFFFSNLYTQIFLSVTTTSNQFIRFPLFLIHYSPKKILMGPIVLTQIATGLGVLAGAALLKSVIDQNPMMGPGPGSGPRCSSCNGTGRVCCLCNRWSDGDRGCRTCAGSGRMVCNSCGGSGTGRPLPVQISVRPPNRPY